MFVLFFVVFSNLQLYPDIVAFRSEALLFSLQLSLKSLSRKAFLHVDRWSGFSLLQAAVLEGDYNIVWKAQALLDNYVKEMNFETTSSDAKLFPGVTAVDILLSLDPKKRGHDDIGKLYQKDVKKCSTLTELHRCVRSDDAEKAIELVVNDGVDINIPALCNRTPLLVASLSSSSVLIKTLIDLGADVNAQRTDDKVAPLLLAAYWNNYMATRLLLERGAHANVQASDGATPLHDAVANNHENLVKLLLENVADANIQNAEGNTPLHLSVRNGNFEISQLLIEAGCNINLRDKNGRTPRHYSVANNRVDIVKLLLKSKRGLKYSRC